MCVDGREYRPPPTLRNVLGVNGYATNQRMNDVNGLTTDQRIPDVAGNTSSQPAASAVTQQQASNQAQKEKPGFIKTANDEITYRIIGLAMEIHNELGPGHREEAYHNALITSNKIAICLFWMSLRFWSNWKTAGLSRNTFPI